MRILYVGDVMAKPGHTVVGQILPSIRQELEVDYVIVQAENCNEDGKGPGPEDINNLIRSGADFFTGGNHSLRGVNSPEVYSDDVLPIIRPANMIDAFGRGWKVVETQNGKILIVSMLGQIVGSQRFELNNPLKQIDEILEETKDENIVARIVNFHGDYSSEKRVFGYYLDGRVSAVIGDHWHVPTADAMVLPKGTAHITDVGMCGTLHSSLGVKTEVIVNRWKTNHSSKNEIEFEGPLQFNAVLVEVDTSTGLSKSISHIQRIIEHNP